MEGHTNRAASLYFRFKTSLGRFWILGKFLQVKVVGVLAYQALRSGLR